MAPHDINWNDLAEQIGLQQVIVPLRTNRRTLDQFLLAWRHLETHGPCDPSEEGLWAWETVELVTASVMSYVAERYEALLEQEDPVS